MLNKHHARHIPQLSIHSEALVLLWRTHGCLRDHNVSLQRQQLGNSSAIAPDITEARPMDQVGARQPGGESLP